MSDPTRLANLEKLWQDKNFDDLKKEAEGYADAYPDDIEGYFYAGRAHLALEDFDEATYFFSMASRIDENHIEVCLTIARLALMNGRISVARHNYRKVLENDPKNHFALTGLGDCAYVEEDYMGAIDFFNQAIAAGALEVSSAVEQENILYKAAHSYQKNNLLDECLTFITKYKPSVFNEPLTLVERDIYRLMGDEKNAELIACTEALYNNVSPVKAKYIVELAQLIHVHGENERVEKLYSELLAMDLENNTKKEALYSRAGLRKELNNNEGALADYNDLLELEEQWYYYTERAEIQIRLKNAKAALSDYNEAIKLQSPPLYDTLKERGDLYLKAKAYDKAIEDYTRLTKLNDAEPDSYLALGKAFNAKKDVKSAFKMYLEAELRGSIKAGELLQKNFAKQMVQIREKASANLMGSYQGHFKRNEDSPLLQKAYGKLWVPDMNKFILGMGDEALKFPKKILTKILDEIKRDMFIITPQGLLYFEGNDVPVEAYYKVEVESEHAILLEVQPTKGGETSRMRLSFYDGSLLFTYPVQDEEVAAKYFNPVTEISLEQKERLTQKQYETNYLDKIEASIAELIG